MEKAKKYIDDFTMRISNEILDNDYEPWVSSWQALNACHLAEEEAFENAEKWIKENYHKYVSWNVEECELNFNTDLMIKDFKKYYKGIIG